MWFRSPRSWAQEGSAHEPQGLTAHGTHRVSVGHGVGPCVAAVMGFHVPARPAGNLFSRLEGHAHAAGNLIDDGVPVGDLVHLGKQPRLFPRAVPPDGKPNAHIVRFFIAAREVHAQRPLSYVQYAGGVAGRKCASGGEQFAHAGMGRFAVDCGIDLTGIGHIFLRKNPPQSGG